MININIVKAITSLLKNYISLDKIDLSPFKISNNAFNKDIMKKINYFENELKNTKMKKRIMEYLEIKLILFLFQFQI